VADDPARGLDPVAARQLLEALAAVARSRQITLLLLVREPRAIAAVTNEVMILRGGRIIEIGTPGQVYARPQNEHTRDLIAAGKLKTRTLSRPPIGEALLTVRELAIAPRIDKVSFEIRRSEAVAIIGRSGSGKTALARVIGGLERAERGTISLEYDQYRGVDLPPERRRDIGLVSAETRDSFNPAVAVGASLTEPLRLEPQLMMDEQAQRLLDLVRAVGLGPDVLESRPAALSDLTLCKLALARALITRPRLLILDDLGNDLDGLDRAELLALFSRLRSDFGLSSLILDRDLEVARALADRTLILDEGRIIEEGKPGEILDAPREPATRALVKARLPEIGALPPIPTSR
jgi:ABC-type glutathione transport system ATPase component